MTTLTVTAKHPGHYADLHRRPGESFTLRARGDFAANWMEAVGWDPKPAPTEPAPAPPPVVEQPAEKPAAPAEPKPAKAKAPATET